MGTRKGSISPVIRMVRELDNDENGPYWTTLEVATQLGTTEATLRRRVHSQPERYTPAALMSLGKITILLWNAGSIEKAKESWRAEQGARPGLSGPGSPRVWMPHEFAERQKLWQRGSYCRRRSRVLASRGNTEGAIAMMAEASEITRELRAQRLERDQKLATSEE